MYSTADVSGFSGGGEGVMGGWRGFGHVGVFANSRNQHTAESEIPPSDHSFHFLSLSFGQTSFCLRPNFCSPHFHALEVSGGDQASSQGQKTFAH